MVAIPRGKEIMAFGDTGALRSVIRVAPIAEQIPTDDAIKSLKQTASDDSRSHARSEQTAQSRTRFVNALRKRRKPIAREKPTDLMVR
jgi:hypothetical protein